MSNTCSCNDKRDIKANLNILSKVSTFVAMDTKKEFGAFLVSKFGFVIRSKPGFE